MSMQCEECGVNVRLVSFCVLATPPRPGRLVGRQAHKPEFSIYAGNLANVVTDVLLAQTFRKRYESVKGAKVGAACFAARAMRGCTMAAGALAGTRARAAAKRRGGRSSPVNMLALPCHGVLPGCGWSHEMPPYAAAVVPRTLVTPLTTMLPCQVVILQVATDSMTGRSKGYGSVRFALEEKRNRPRHGRGAVLLVAPHASGRVHPEEGTRRRRFCCSARGHVGRFWYGR